MENNTRSGIGFLGLLGIVFIALKLTGDIDWSWWLVTAPLWGLVALRIALFVIIGFVALTVGVAAAVIQSKKSSGLRSVGK